jgi:hypothetical protein
VSPGSLFKVINLLTAETSVDKADEIALYDTSAATADKATVTNLFYSIATFTAETAIDPPNDSGVFIDLTAAAPRTASLGAISSPTLTSEIATTSGAIVTLSSSVPSWAKRITIIFEGVSTSGTDRPLVQIGDAGGLETSGYLSSSSGIAAGVGTDADTTGFGIRSLSAANLITGHMVLTLKDAANFTWVASHTLSLDNTPTTIVGGGSKSLSQALSSVSLTTVGGTDTFDAGSVALMYE